MSICACMKRTQEKSIQQANNACLGGGTKLRGFHHRDFSPVNDTFTECTMYFFFHENYIQNVRRLGRAWKDRCHSERWKQVEGQGRNILPIRGTTKKDDGAGRK